MATNLLNNRYAVLEKLDEGTFGQVFRCWDHRKHKQMALKMIDITSSITEAQAYREALFLKVLRHNSIIRLKEDFVVGDYHYLVLDYISMGSLFHVVKSKGAFTLSCVKRYARSLMEVLAFLKKNGVVHGDLKLENILVKYHHTAAIRLADFGGSFFENEPPDHSFGTAGYQAPEVLLAQPFGTAVDMWAAGYILAEISVARRLLKITSTIQEVAGITKIVGRPPLMMLHAAPDGPRYFNFFGQLTKECRQETPQCCPLKEFLKTRDPLFLDFISSILRWNPDDRLTPESALKHPWMSAAPAPPPGFHQAPASKINSHLAPSTKTFRILNPNNFTSKTKDPYKLCCLDSDPNDVSIPAPAPCHLPSIPQITSPRQIPVASFCSSSSGVEISIVATKVSTAISLPPPAAVPVPFIQPRTDAFLASVSSGSVIETNLEWEIPTATSSTSTIKRSIQVEDLNTAVSSTVAIADPLPESETRINLDIKPLDVEEFPISIEAVDERTQNGAETSMCSILSLPINADDTVNPLLESESTVKADSKPHDAEQMKAMVQSDMDSAEKIIEVPKSQSPTIRKRLHRFGRALIKLVCCCGGSGEGD
ncbi:uncharacterized protein LOC142915382 isoform X1 [Petromyzon marinus]|uniref:uncharacterized protein LOC142915382 isoform X1 n=1 Tax=Petromyzon marinus TaxID=7757 RepID=UPI003F6FEB11